MLGRHIAEAGIPASAPHGEGAGRHHGTHRPPHSGQHQDFNMLVDRTENINFYSLV